MPQQQPPLLIGISGPSSSGKTTLSRLLRTLFPPSHNLFILHLDDFYLTDAAIPLKNGFQDWDCLESLDLPGLASALAFIRKEGKTPDWLTSKEDQNSVGDHGVPESVLSGLRSRLCSALARCEGRSICVVDGFLLFSEDMEHIRRLFDVRLFLRVGYQTAKRRRERRSGYVTLEGFWEDPPGYVDRIVWPNYVADHAFLFKEGDVEGEMDEGVCERVGVKAMPREAEGDMGVCLEWAVGVLEAVIRGG
ncbi:P-loop containing nucleoside triphosphate hydrolase protein [Clathrospora elynae]|uniref:P-loop containing nucleoside triphosphate hydrolase protein n=1 Tax=Clathrospora elynae TaxID=706981 RepID=A0A6A5SN13_9PLEO|nr:P-loop containing nucleoside triphosphate hydrolase protein [Clathrospora elynae]